MMFFCGVKIITKSAIGKLFFLYVLLKKPQIALKKVKRVFFAKIIFLILAHDKFLV